MAPLRGLVDWMTPEAWRHEHNLLHHCRLNEDPGDPDLVEALVEKDRPRPRWVRWLLLAFYSVAWKPLYYGPNTLRLYLNAAARRRDPSAAAVAFGDPCVLNPLHPYGRQVWLRCWFPYAAWKFAVAPALFLPLGWWAWLFVLLNTLLAEALTNFHSFLMIVPNHAGEDLYRFDAPVKGGKGEFYVRPDRRFRQLPLRRRRQRPDARLAQLPDRAPRLAGSDPAPVPAGAACSSALCESTAFLMYKNRYSSGFGK